MLSVVLFTRPLVFLQLQALLRQDMLLHIPIIANVCCIFNRHQLLIDRAGIARHNCCHFYNYGIKDQMIIVISEPDALQERTFLHLTIVNIHTNNTVSYLQNINAINTVNIH